MSTSKIDVNEVFNKIYGVFPYAHQKKTIEALIAGKSVVLRAPCGSGKTEACSASFILGRGTLPDRLIYSLPTRALASEIADRIKVSVDQSRYQYKVSAQHGASSNDPFFKSDIIVTTIDQTIGAYCCTPLSLPAYLGNIPAGAAVSGFHCFDEVHTYDRYLGLQSTLILIKRSSYLGLPFLVMSATLPDSFLRWFEKKFGETVEIVEGDDDSVMKRRKRHVILHWEGKSLGSIQVFEGAETFDKIMVVCNTVDRAQALYNAVLEPLREKGFNVFLLHSRFLEKDRKIIEDRMRKSLNDALKTCLITTQVCEVGLDISCELLLTELAPADSLIQRMGRCARDGKKGEVHVFDVKHPSPYRESELIECKNYISERLNSKRVGWKEELDLVNNILGQTFEPLINDEQRQNSILNRLGDAAFKGSKKDVERNVRELFSANLTIHRNPNLLSLKDAIHMPWLNVDVRVLNKHLAGKAMMWKAEFGHDENGYQTVEFVQAKEILPFDFYVIDPEFVRYTPDCGLVFGLKGESFNPQKDNGKPREKITYQEETWETHTRNSVAAFENKIKLTESHALLFLSKLLGNTLERTEGLVALAVALHDLGKLNIEWQRKIGAAEVPLAHTAITNRSPLPPHATVSAYALSGIFDSLFEKRIYASAFKLAVGHHHHTRAENVPQFELGWKDIYERTIQEIDDQFKLGLDRTIADRVKIPTPTLLDSSFPDFEKIKPYTVYCIASRLIRLSDRASFDTK